MSFLTVDSIIKRYGSLDVLKEVSFELDEGGFLVLVGPSGCGKSTLLGIIAGFEHATGGELKIGGRRVNELLPSERDIAMVFQSYALYPNMTVRGNIAFGLEMRGVPKAEREQAVKAAAEVLQITHLLDRRPSQLSGGQRQRVAMGRALVRKPQVFLFDEPLSNLDAKLRVEMRTEIKRLHQRTGVTMVYVTHDQIEAMTLATKIAVMNGGVIQQIGTPAEIYERPANLFVAQFMGSPAMNLLDAEFSKAGEGSFTTIVGTDIRVDTSSLVDHSAMAGRKAIIGIRPEAITLQSEIGTTDRSVTRFSAPIEILEPTGPDIFVVFRLGGREITARVPAGSNLAVGRPAELAIYNDKLVLFDAETEAAVSLTRWRAAA